MEKVTIFWFRRDLRIEDNTGLYYAMKEKNPVLPIFIFDRNILDKLEDPADARVEFIQKRVNTLNNQLKKEYKSGILTFYETPITAFKKLLQDYQVGAVYTNRDYEPYALHRDQEIEKLLKENNTALYDFKDQVLFEGNEILTEQQTFYKVYSPYMRSWMSKFENLQLRSYDAEKSGNYLRLHNHQVHSLEEMGFKPTQIEIPSDKVPDSIIKTYDKTRNFPGQQGTTKLGIHLRHGTISIRKLIQVAAELNKTYLNELIWREFYMMILFHNPHVVDQAFKPAYNNIEWRNNEEEFERWCTGNTGYPIVDAGMRELNTTGYMHNRVRMIVASFLTKHLLIDWRLGEAYFGKKLLDYELSSNNGGWQWAASTGTDAQPYFRIFNPYSQTEKFDKNLTYIRNWVPEFQEFNYQKPIVDHKMARQRALDTFKRSLEKT